jgi:hypothetical protein
LILVPEDFRIEEKMKKFLNTKSSGNILIIFLIILIVFHVLVLMKIIPFEMLWGGQIKNSSSLFIYEGFAVFLTIIFLLIISMKIGYINPEKFVKVVNFGVWLVFVYFLMNTIGNFSSGITIEKWIFTPITIIMTILAFRLAIEK